MLTTEHVAASELPLGYDSTSGICDNHSMRRLWFVVAMLCACNPKPATGQTDTKAEDKKGEVGESGGEKPKPVATPKPNVEFLEQGWSADLRNQFYYTSQGSHLLPYDWYLALEHPDAPTLLRDDAYLKSLRFLVNPDEAGGLNPGKLPIGLTYETDKEGQHWLGMTCAACHTGQFTYKGKTVRVDGGPTLANIAIFLKDVQASLKKTSSDKEKFARFATRVLGADASADDRTKLREQLKQQIERMPSEHPDAGFGREDAFGVIFNEVTATQLGIPENFREADAPVSFPHIWGTPHLSWVQYNGLVENPIARNIGEVLGVYGHVDYPDTVVEGGFSSTIELKNLFELEEWVASLEPPKWPEQLPKIDAAKAARGKPIYTKNCSGCHPLAPHPMTAAKDNQFGKQWVEIKMVPVEKIGTDPLVIKRIAERTAKTGKLAPYFKGAKEVPAVQLLFLAANMIFEHEAKELGLTKEQQVAYAGFRIPGQDPPNLLAYKARPLDGIWATAPFLHNGSVPNLYEMLLPAAKRSSQFSVGSTEFDPKKVGYVSNPSPGAYTFDTSLPGNANSGHEFATDLSEDDRWALIEFLKTL